MCIKMLFTFLMQHSIFSDRTLAVSSGAHKTPFIYVTFGEYIFRRSKYENDNKGENAIQNVCVCVYL